MRRIVLIVPGMLSDPEGDSFLRQPLPALSKLTDLGALHKVAAIPPSETPEAMLLGLSPDLVHLRQGPLTVSALGFDPPERSTHFHLSLMSFDDGTASTPAFLPTAAEVNAVMAGAKRLDTKWLTLLKGEALDHGLVWESLGDMGTTPATTVAGKKVASYLPEGDGEAPLRRLIDDSVNLLSALELNERRVDAGLPAFNFLWPWGHGVRTPVPNLALRRGEPATVESASMRLAGLTRLAGYRHFDRHAFGRGLQTQFRPIVDRALARDVTIVYIEAPADFRVREQPEELDWFVRELDRELLQPLLDDLAEVPTRLCLITPAPINGSSPDAMRPSPLGLALTVEGGAMAGGSYPLDERSLEERSIPTEDLWRIVESALAS